jgi:hypothetical protein
VSTRVVSVMISDSRLGDRDGYSPPAMGPHTIWEPAAGEGSMADALVSAGFRVVSTDLKNRIDFLDDKTWPNIAQRRRRRYQSALWHPGQNG